MVYFVFNLTSVSSGNLEKCMVMHQGVPSSLGCSKSYSTPVHIKIFQFTIRAATPITPPIYKYLLDNADGAAFH